MRNQTRVFMSRKYGATILSITTLSITSHSVKTPSNKGLIIDIQQSELKVSNVNIIKSSRPKVVRARRSTVLSFPLQLGFPGTRQM